MRLAHGRFPVVVDPEPPPCRTTRLPWVARRPLRRSGPTCRAVHTGVSLLRRALQRRGGRTVSSSAAAGLAGGGRARRTSGASVGQAGRRKPGLAIGGQQGRVRDWQQVLAALVGRRVEARAQALQRAAQGLAAALEQGLVDKVKGAAVTDPELGQSADAGADGLSDLFRELVVTTGEQLAVRVTATDGGPVFRGATPNAPEVPWTELDAAAPTASEYFRYVSIDATTTRASTVIRSIPTRETRTQASMTMPLSSTRSRTSMRLDPPDTRSTAM